MTRMKILVVLIVLGVATVSLAQDSTQVWGIRVLATDAEAVATFDERSVRDAISAGVLAAARRSAELSGS